MSWIQLPGIGLVHLQDVKPPKVVPGHERHKWDCKPNWGEQAKCLKCGCVKYMLKCAPYWAERYQPFGSPDLLKERPPCTATPPIPFNPGK